jgi:hypothetical protein
MRRYFGMNIQDGFARLHGTDPQPTPTPELLQRWSEDPDVEKLGDYLISLLPSNEREEVRMILWAETVTRASFEIIGNPVALTVLADALKLGERFPESSVVDDDGMATLELSVDEVSASFRIRQGPTENRV